MPEPDPRRRAFGGLEPLGTTQRPTSPRRVRPGGREREPGRRAAAARVSTGSGRTGSGRPHGARGGCASCRGSCLPGRPRRGSSRGLVTPGLVPRRSDHGARSRRGSSDAGRASRPGAAVTRRPDRTGPDRRDLPGVRDPAVPRSPAGRHEIVARRGSWRSSTTALVLPRRGRPGADATGEARPRGRTRDSSSRNSPGDGRGRRGRRDRLDGGDGGRRRGRADRRAVGRVSASTGWARCPPSGDGCGAGTTSSGSASSIGMAAARGAGGRRRRRRRRMAAHLGRARGRRRCPRQASRRASGRRRRSRPRRGDPRGCRETGRTARARRRRGRRREPRRCRPRRPGLPSRPCARARRGAGGIHGRRSAPFRLRFHN